MKTHIATFTFGVITAGLAFAPVIVLPASAGPRIETEVSIGFSLPRGSTTITVGREHYHYHRGNYYRSGRGGYILVPAPRGARIRSLPYGYSRVIIRNNVYYRYNGFYYAEDPYGYVVVDAPIIETLPQEPVTPKKREPSAGYQSVWVGSEVLLVKNGQFFKQTAEGLNWVKAPLGAIIAKLPTYAVSVWYQDDEYFDADGVYYKKTPSGFRVIEAPWGAVKPALPEKAN